MAARITVKGLGIVDGTFDMPEDFNLGELFFIEQTVGIKAGELNAAVQGGSVGLLACMVAIALKRAGKTPALDTPMELLWSAKDDNIDVETVEAKDEGEDAERPLASTPTPSGSPSEPGVERSPDET